MHSNNLSNYSCDFQCYSEQLLLTGHEANEYSEELSLFSQELFSRVKYDEHMHVLSQEFLSYSISASVLANELLCHSEIMALIGALTEEFSMELCIYSCLLREYLEPDT